MFVYFLKDNNNILWISKFRVAQTPDQLQTPEEIIPVFENTYDVVELDVDLPYNFKPYKYKLVDDKILYAGEGDEIQDKWEKIRVERDILLQDSDIKSKIIWPDLWNQIDEYTQNAWISYRQSLRDIPQGDNPDSVVWPNIPTPIVDENSSEVVAQIPE